MATSGSRDFSLDVAEIIEESYELIGLELRTGYDAQRARRSLNILMSDWMNRGLNLWSIYKDTTTLTEDDVDITMNTGDIDVTDAVIRRGTTDYAITRITRNDYLNLPNKTQTGRPNQIYVERSNPPVVYLWPAPENSTDQLITYRVRHLEDADTLVDDVDVPARFIPAMVSGLAYYLARKLAPDRVQEALIIYEQDFDRAANQDTEKGSLFIRPERVC